MDSNCHTLLEISLAAANAQITLVKFIYFWNPTSIKIICNFYTCRIFLLSSIRNLGVFLVEILLGKVSWRCSYRTHLSHANVRLTLRALSLTRSISRCKSYLIWNQVGRTCPANVDTLAAETRVMVAKVAVAHRSPSRK
jgi:hypothetical protein